MCRPGPSVQALVLPDPGALSAALGVGTQKPRVSFVFDGPKPSFRPFPTSGPQHRVQGLLPAGRSPQVCLAGLACRAFGAQALSMALGSTRWGTLEAPPPVCLLPLALVSGGGHSPSSRPDPTPPISSGPHGLVPLTWLTLLAWPDMKVTGVTALPNCTPKSLQTYTGPWVTHRPHSGECPTGRRVSCPPW